MKIAVQMKRKRKKYHQKAFIGVNGADEDVHVVAPAEFGQRYFNFLHIGAFDRLRQTHFRVAVERVDDLPSQQDSDVDRQQHSDHHEELVIFNSLPRREGKKREREKRDGNSLVDLNANFSTTHLLVELDVGEDGVDAPRFGEHGAEGEREAGHQGPDARRADHRQRRLARQVRIQAEQDDARVRQQAADDDHVVQVGTRHFDVSATFESIG